MHIIAGKISAQYSGRGNSFLPPYDRILIMKNDSSVSIHSEKGFKPLNYMTAPTVMSKRFEDDKQIYIFDSRKECLEVTVHEVYNEIVLPLGDDEPGLQMDGTEAHLQKWLSENITVLGEEMEFIQREFPTGDGPVDLLGECDNILYAIEVKRVAPINTVGQVDRYIEGLKLHFPDREIRGIIAAVEIKTKTKVLAERRNIQCIEVPSDWNNKI